MPDQPAFGGNLAVQNFTVISSTTGATPNQEFILGEIQRRIVHGLTFDKEETSDQIGIEPFIIEDLRHHGARRVKVKALESNRYQISFVDWQGRIRNIIYVQEEFNSQDVASQTRNETFDLIFIKGTIIGDFSPRIFQSLKDGGIYICDIKSRQHPDSIFKKNGLIKSVS